MDPAACIQTLHSASTCRFGGKALEIQTRDATAATGKSAPTANAQKKLMLRAAFNKPPHSQMKVSLANNESIMKNIVT